MIRALPTTIRLANGETQSVLWGLPEKSEQEETLMVGHALKHFSAVDVSVVGVRITEEIPYKATLTAIFPDGTRRQRSNVEGVLQRKYLNNIRPEYSRVYRIKDSIVVSSQQSVTERLPKVQKPPPVKNSYSYSMNEDVKKRDNHRMLSDQTKPSDKHSSLVQGNGSSIKTGFSPLLLAVIATTLTAAISRWLHC